MTSRRLLVSYSSLFFLFCMAQPNNPHWPSGPNFGDPPPKNWLVESILVTIFCCLPFGIVGIINASNVNSKYAMGDYAGAQVASAEAGKWTKIGFFVGLAATLLPLLFALATIILTGTNMLQDFRGWH